MENILDLDAGLQTIVDIETRNAYCDFKDKWYAENLTRIYGDGCFFLMRFLQRMLRRIQFIKERVETDKLLNTNSELNSHDTIRDLETEDILSIL